MTIGLLIASGGVLFVVGIIVVAYVGDWESESTEHARAALETVSFGRDDSLVDGDPSIDHVPEVNTHRDGDPIVVPVATVELDADEDPDRASGYRIAAAMLGALHPEYTDSHVRNYDILLAYGDSSWVSGGEKRRIAVTPDLAERLAREPDFDAADLRREVESRDDGDDEIPPVAWGEPLQYRQGDAATSAAAVTTAGVY